MNTFHIEINDEFVNDLINDWHTFSAKMQETNNIEYIDSVEPEEVFPETHILSFEELIKSTYLLSVKFNQEAVDGFIVRHCRNYAQILYYIGCCETNSSCIADGFSIDIFTFISSVLSELVSQAVGRSSFNKKLSGTGFVTEFWNSNNGKTITFENDWLEGGLLEFAKQQGWI